MFGCSKTIVILIFATWIAPWPTYGLPHEFQINPIATCGVIEDRSKVEKTCIFPFSFRNITYTNCTTVTDPDNKAWCSTKVDQNGVHFGSGGYWGYCPEECIQGSRTTTTATTTSTTTTTTTTATTTLAPTTTTIDAIEATNIENFKIALNEIAEDDTEDILIRTNMRPKSSLLDSSCNCTKEKECAWLSKVVQLEESIPKDHILWIRAQELKSYVRCAAGKVRCCNGEKREPDENRESVPRTNNFETKYDFPSDISLGTWKPLEESGDCGNRVTNENIVGGQIAQIGEFPYMALLGYIRDNGNRITYDCGGSLINKRYVLTAAHCQSDKRPISKVVLGEHTLASGKDCLKSYCAPAIQEIDVDEVIVHEKYNPKIPQVGYDIALVRMKELAVLTYDDTEASIISPVCLPWGSNDPGQRLRDGDSFIVTGWGKVTNDNVETRISYTEYGTASRTLQKLEMPGIPRGKCVKDPTFKNINKEIQLCAGGEDGKDSCNGDSGGPLVYRKGNQEGEPWYQVGIVSFGTRECGIGSPAIYTRITAFLDWIAEHLKP